MPRRSGFAQHIDREVLGLVPGHRIGREALVGESLGHFAHGDVIGIEREHGDLIRLHHSRREHFGDRRFEARRVEAH